MIYFTDPIDEYVTGQLTEFDDKKFQDATKEDLKVGERDEDEKKKFKETKEEFKDLTKWWKVSTPQRSQRRPHAGHGIRAILVGMCSRTR